MWFLNINSLEKESKNFQVWAGKRMNLISPGHLAMLESKQLSDGRLMLKSEKTMHQGENT